MVEDNKLTRLIKSRARPVPLEKIWKGTSKIKGTMTEEVRKMREEDD